MQVDNDIGIDDCVHDLDIDITVDIVDDWKGHTRCVSAWKGSLFIGCYATKMMVSLSWYTNYRKKAQCMIAVLCYKL